MELSQLIVKHSELSSDALYPSMQTPVLTILSVEIIFIPLALLWRVYHCILPRKVNWDFQRKLQCEPRSFNTCKWINKKKKNSTLEINYNYLSSVSYLQPVGAAGCEMSLALVTWICSGLFIPEGTCAHRFTEIYNWLSLRHKTLMQGLNLWLQSTCMNVSAQWRSDHLKLSLKSKN